MNSSLRFTAKTTLFAVIFFAAVVGLSAFKRKQDDASDYMAAIVDKHARLAATKPPRILFGGGSNVAFGVDSAAVEAALGVPVVNLGLHAGLGLGFILREMKAAIQPHDVVVLSIEYYLPMATADQYPFVKNASDFYPPAREYYDENVRQDISLFLERRRSTIRSLFWKTPVDQIYSRRNFNERGDEIANLTAPRPSELRDRGRLDGGRWAGIPGINEFVEFARRRNVRVFYAYPCYPESEFAKNKDRIAELDTDLHQNLRAELLGSPTDFTYPDSEFFDTVYHLSGHGRERRTRQLIRALREKLGARGT